MSKQTWTLENKLLKYNNIIILSNDFFVLDLDFRLCHDIHFNIIQNYFKYSFKFHKIEQEHEN